MTVIVGSRARGEKENGKDYFSNAARVCAMTSL